MQTLGDRLAAFIARCAEDTYPEERYPVHDTITARAAPLVAEHIPKGGRVLDVGSGQGPALEWFTEHGFDVIGIDINEANARACFERGFSVIHCDQNDLPHEWTERFDLVWARHVLEHSPIPFFTLTEFHRVLKPGGVLYVEVPAPDTDCKHETNANHYSVFGAQM